MKILKGILGAWKIPYLYFCAWRTWRAQRKNLTIWGRNYGLEPPRDDETNDQYRKRVYDAISGIVECVDDSILLKHGSLSPELAEAYFGHLKICPECKHTATAVTNQCFNSNCINYGEEIK